MRRIAVVLGVVLALVPAAALAKPRPNMHCPAGGTKVEGAGTHRVLGLKLVVAGRSVSISGPANAVVELCVKASTGNTGIRSVTLDANGEAVFNSDVLNKGGNVAAVSYTVVYSVERPEDHCPDKPGYQDEQDDCDPLGSSESQTRANSAPLDGDADGVDGTLSSAFERDASLTGAHVIAVLLGAVALNVLARRLLLRRR